ncbi:MAG: TIGR02444 family protein [Alteromonadaceae bacterium]|nr:TIGR02444 family protein [Alteromonadaceae bacterium]
MSPFNSDSFWQFSLEFYSPEPIKQACLTLQDNFDFNVNLILLCCWLDSLRVKLSAEQLHQLKGVIKNSDVELKQHRKLRAANKNQQDRYAALLQQELALEQAQQSILVSTLNSMKVVHVSTDNQKPNASLFENTQLCFSGVGAEANKYLSVFKQYIYKNN